MKKIRRRVHKPPQEQPAAEPHPVVGEHGGPKRLNRMPAPARDQGRDRPNAPVRTKRGRGG